MRIGLDLRILDYNTSGISRYIKGIVPEILKLNSRHEIILFCSRKSKKEGYLKNAQTLYTPPHFLFENISLPLELKKYKLDYFHAFDFFAPTPKKTKLIASVYDLYFLKNSNELDKSFISHYLKIGLYLKTASHIISCSHSTEKDIYEILPDANNIHMMYPGFNCQYWKNVSSKKLYDFEYILFVGTHEPRKNILRLFSAYNMLKEKMSVLPRLIIAGRLGPSTDAIKNYITEHNLENEIIILGETCETDLISLYKHSKLLAYPSLYEGFGFPILEAWASEVPVITSNNSSLAEIGEGAAILVNPLDVSSIADGLFELLTDPVLRNKLISAGKENVLNFTWEKSAREVMNLYDSLDTQEV